MIISEIKKTCVTVDFHSVFNDYLVFVLSWFLFYQFEECIFKTLKQGYIDLYNFFKKSKHFYPSIDFTIWHKYLKVQHFPFDFVIQGLFYLYLSSRTLSHAVSFLDDKALMVDCFHATDLILFFQYEATEGENTIDLFWAVRKEKGNIRSHGSSQCFRYQIHVLVLLSFWQLQIYVKLPRKLNSAFLNFNRLPLFIRRICQFSKIILKPY